MIRNFFSLKSLPLIMSGRWLTGMLLMALPAIASSQAEPPTTLVTIPTAGTLPRGQVTLETLMQKEGGVLAGVGVGIGNRFSIGMSYAIHRLIGDAKPALSGTIPAVQLKYRIVEENLSWPAIALGLDTQGRGEFQTHTVFTDSSEQKQDFVIERFEVKAIGLYLVASKNWQALGNFGGHLGVSKNLQEADQLDNDINLFFGLDKDIGSNLSLFLEYNAALDDNNYNIESITVSHLADIRVGDGRGYLNGGFRWNVTPSLAVELDFNDILTNRGKVDYLTRELKLIYREYF